MINIAVCDDDYITTTEIETLVKSFLQANHLTFNITLFFNGENLLQTFNKKIYYDIIFLDIEMEVNGITVAKKLRETNNVTLIIYISAYTSYALDLFDVEPFRFIKKPIDHKIFNKYLDLAIKRILSEKQIYTFRYKQMWYSILLKDILYFESNLHIVYIYTVNSIYIHNKKLGDIEKNLKNAYPPFLRIHQSYLVNLKYIQSINFSEVTLFNNTKLQISEKRQKNVQKQFIQIMELL